MAILASCCRCSEARATESWAVIFYEISRCNRRSLVRAITRLAPSLDAIWIKRSSNLTQMLLVAQLVGTVERVGHRGGGLHRVAGFDGADHETVFRDRQVQAVHCV